jgi:hypothetical protein
MDIDKLLASVKESIEVDKLKLGNVGNRPHYPAFIAFNGADTDNCSLFTQMLGNVWPEQIIRSVVMYRYICSSNGLVFRSTDSDDAVEINCVNDALESVNQQSEMFSSHHKWCLFNIIDTRKLDFEEFKAAYSSLNELIDTIDTPVKSMAIILLEDSRSRAVKQKAYLIRDFIRNKKDYEGLIIMSNRTRGGREYSFDKLYSIAAKTILLADNDAKTSTDDLDYSDRVSKLYSPNTDALIVSYNSLEKPTMKILFSMAAEALETAKSSIAVKSTDSLYMIDELNELLDIHENQIALFRSYLQKIKKELLNEQVYNTIMDYAPLSSPYIPAKGAKKSARNSEYAAYVKPSSLKLIIDRFARRFFESDECGALLDAYQKRIREKITLGNVYTITPAMISGAFERLKLFEMDTSGGTLEESFVNKVINEVTYSLIYRQCERMVTEYCRQSVIKQSIDNLERLYTEVVQRLSFSWADSISKQYVARMKEFLRTEEGIKCLNGILSMSDDSNDVYNALTSTLYRAEKYFADTISKPFIQMWADTMKQQGQDILTKIRSELKGDGQNGIMLRGGYPVLDVMSVYMMHTVDRNGDNPTLMYRQLEEAFREMDTIQFFNTGNDDSIEVLSYYRCDGDNLILGLRPEEIGEKNGV